MLKMLTFALVTSLTLAAPGLAQDHAGHSGTNTHAHDGHAHAEEPGAAPTQAGAPAAIVLSAAPGAEIIEAEILGMVCDFCATALTKTAGRRSEIAAVDVNLDTKLLTLVVAPGGVFDDAAVEDLVVRAGYRTAEIRRRVAGENEDTIDAIDPS